MTERTSINPTALAIFIVFFALIAVLGFVADSRPMFERRSPSSSVRPKPSKKRPT